MRGVDKLDQQLHAYDCCRKSYRWFKKLGIHFIQRAILNAFYVCKEKSESNLTLLSFLNLTIDFLVEGMTADITQLDAGQPVPRKRRRQQARRQAAQVTVHTPQTFNPTARRQRPQRRCVMCPSQGVRRDTRYYCCLCPNQPALCMPGCFNAYQHVQ
jgi:hypothetical protein